MLFLPTTRSTENEISCVGFLPRASRQTIAAGAYAPAATALPEEQGRQAESQGARSSAWLKCLLRLRGVYHSSVNGRNCVSTFV